MSFANEMLFSPKKIYDRIFPIGKIVRDAPYALVFKTTNYCWMRCAHCLEDSGPHNPREFMHENIIINYIAQASRDPKFSGEVVFTGGEIFAAYKRGLAYYVPKLLKTCVEHGISADIKTNAAWVRMKEASQIFHDLDEIARLKRPYAYQISLSLDKYHTRSLDNVATVLETLGRMQTPVLINITSFENSIHMYDELKTRMADKNMPVISCELRQNGKMRDVDVVNGRVIIRPPEPTIPLPSGRAKKLSEASKQKFPQFHIVYDDGIVPIAFDPYGHVTVGEKCDNNIWTPFITQDGKYKDLPQIKKELAILARCDEWTAMTTSTWLFHRLKHKISKSRL